MTTFYMSFRIKDEKSTKGTYGQRYAALADALEKVCGESWLAPTSFCVFSSEKSRQQIAALVRNALDPAKDMAIIGMTERKGVTVIGDYEDEIDVLRSLIPFIVQA